MLRPTFLGFRTATSGLKVNQSVMDVIGQNISNINTKGYTRQRLDTTSLAFNTSSIKFGPTGVVIGQGVNANGTSQFRDPFLDLRYRTQAAKAGSEQVQTEALGDLEKIMDEINNDKINEQFSHLVEQLRNLTSNPSDPVMEGVVRTSAQMLTQMFNNYSNQIDTVRDQQLNYLEDGAIVRVNQLMENISKLNKQIRDDNLSGNPALELNDQRNLLIDELADYMDIEVVTTPLPIGAGKTIDELSIVLRGQTDADGKSIKLVDNDQFGKFDIDKVNSTDDKVMLKFTKIDGTTDSDFNSKIKGGQIEGYLKILNGKGDFATGTDNFEKSQGVLYYRSMLDTLASTFANEMNKLNISKEISDIPALDADGNQVKDAEGNLMYEHPLFWSDEAEITAGSIKISQAWLKSTGSYLINKNTPSEGNDDTGATDNILKMIDLFNKDHEFKTPGGVDIFKGKIQEFLAHTITRLNLQKADTQTSYDAYAEGQFQLDYARSSMSSVDMNEEGVNLLQYSKSYNASARLMTVLDEMLDTLINRMAV